MFSAAVNKSARAHAERAYPAESCGLVVRAGPAGAEIYQPCINIAADPRTRFKIPPKTILSAQKKGLAAIVHSHPAPAPPAPSDTDRRAQLAFDLPWGIVPVDERGRAGEMVWFGCERGSL